MKLLRVIASMDPSHGGPCQGVRNSIPQLEVLGIHNEVVCLDEPNAVFLSKDLFSIHAIGRGGKGWNYNAKLLPWLLENMQHFDAVIVHGLWLYHSYAVRKAIRMLKQDGSAAKESLPKIYVMPHGMLDPYFQRAPERKLKAVRNWLYYKLIEGKVVNEADGLFFTCEEELKLASIPFRPYRPKREVNIGYGIATPPTYKQSIKEAFQKNCPGIGERPYLLFLSRIHKKKGVDLLIKAYSNFLKSQTLLPKEEPAVPALVIAGPGLDSAYGKQMQQLVSELGLSQKLFFPGMLSGESKWGAFYGCEAFILPSHQENFGIAVVEALACGKPVLISSQINIWQEIKTAQAGIVAEDSLQGICEALNKWVMLTIEQREDLGRNARRCFELNFAIEPAAQRLRKALQEEYVPSEKMI